METKRDPGAEGAGVPEAFDRLVTAIDLGNITGSANRQSALERQALPIRDIIVANRCRRDMGNIKSLAASIERVGLLHPIVIRPDRVLIAGARRLEACKALGWSEVPVRVVDLTEIAHGEFDENTVRKDFLPSEIEAIRRALMPIEQEAARARETLGKVSPPSEAGRVRDKLGLVAGVSGRTVEKIAKVAEAAETDPEKFGDLLAQMDRTGKVDPAFRELRSRRQGDFKKRTFRPAKTDAIKRAVAGSPRENVDWAAFPETAQFIAPMAALAPKIEATSGSIARTLAQDIARLPVDFRRKVLRSLDALVEVHRRVQKAFSDEVEGGAP